MIITKKPKIAILTIRNSYNYGGVLSSLKVTYQFCNKYFEPKVFFLGFDHEIATSLRLLKFTSAAKPLSYFGMNCVEIGARWSFWEPGHYAFTLRYWKKMLQDYDYFFVVSGTCIAAHPLILLNKKFPMWIGTPYNEDRAERIKQLKGLRFVLNQLAQPRMNAIEKEILKKASYTWAISSYAKTKFEHIIGHAKDSTVLCGYPMDCATAQLPEKSNTLEKIIIAVGRFSDPRKNIDMLIRVFAKLQQKLPSLKLYIIGMKPLHEKIAKYSDLPCFENIVFTGQIAGEDLASLHKRAHLMLITSHQEGLGIVGLEALLHGIPVIATNCGGPTDYVVDNVTGFLVPINDDDTMVKKAHLVLTDPELYQRLSHEGRKLVENFFSVSKIYTSFKHGLTATYPDLQKWFQECDNSQSHVNKGKINARTTQDIL